MKCHFGQIALSNISRILTHSCRQGHETGTNIFSLIRKAGGMSSKFISEGLQGCVQQGGGQFVPTLWQVPVRGVASWKGKTTSLIEKYHFSSPSTHIVRTFWSSNNCIFSISDASSVTHKNYIVKDELSRIISPQLTEKRSCGAA